MKLFILLSILLSQVLIAGRPGEEMDHLIFPDGRDRHGILRLGQEVPHPECYKKANWDRRNRKEKLDQWFKLFPMLTADEPTDEKCRTIIRSYHATESIMWDHKPRGPLDLQVENWHEKSCNKFISSLSTIIQAACHFYPPALSRIDFLFMNEIGLGTPYAINKDHERLRFYDDLEDHAKDKACYDDLCLACRWGVMYKSILEDAEKKYEAQQRLLAALESPRETLTEGHGPDEGVASASSDDEHDLAPVSGDSRARQLLIPPTLTALSSEESLRHRKH